MRSSTATRSATVVVDQAGNALRAAATAWSTSSAEPTDTVPQTCSVAGLTTSIVCGLAGSTHSPPM
jgi:hypothetical protein